MLRYIPLLAVFAISGMVLAAPGGNDPWIGSWTVTATPSGLDANLPGAKTFNETLKFDGAKMSVKVLADKGFGPAEYQEDVSAIGTATFDCTQTSDKEGKIVWHGMTTTSQDLQGTLVWTRKDGTIIHYDLTGNKSGT